ncbi:MULTISPECIES: hypothetical protein [Okeania]|nr:MULTISPECIES: hypothetical protein [Okeania]
MPETFPEYLVYLELSRDFQQVERPPLDSPRLFRNFSEETKILLL